MNAIERKFSKHFGTSAEKPGFEVEIRFKDGTSHSCAIVRFKNEKLFRTACKDASNGGLNNFEFGSKNVLKCVPFDDIEVYKNLGDAFVLPKADKVSKMFTDDCRNWLCDDKCREQLLLRYGQETE